MLSDGEHISFKKIIFAFYLTRLRALKFTDCMLTSENQQRNQSVFCFENCIDNPKYMH